MNRAIITSRLMRVLRYLGIRLLITAICLLPLFLGVSVMLCGRYERAQRSLVPRYLWSDAELIKKHFYTMAPDLTFLADRYGSSEFENMAAFRSCENPLAIIAAHIQASSLDLKGRKPAARDLNDYKNSIDSGLLIVPGKAARDLFPVFLKKKYSVMAEELFRAVQSTNDIPEWMMARYSSEAERMAVLENLDVLSVALLNQDLGASYSRYEDVPVPRQTLLREPRWLPDDTTEWAVWSDFVRGLPCQYKWMPTKEVYWRSFLRRRYKGSVQDLNAAWGTQCESISAAPFPDISNAGSKLGGDWADFVLHAWPRSMLELPQGYDAAWEAYVETRVGEDGMLAGLLDRDAGNGVPGLKLPLLRPSDPVTDMLWCDFIESGAIPAKEIGLITHTDRFGPFLRSNYLGGRIISLNEEWHTSFDVFADVPLPISLSDISLFQFRNPRTLRMDYAYSAWFSAIKTLQYPAGIVRRTAISVGTLTLVSVLLSVLWGYALARTSMNSAARLSTVCLVAALVPASSYLLGYDISLTSSLGARQRIVMALLGVNMMTVVLMRNWFVRVIERFAESTRDDNKSKHFEYLRFVSRSSAAVVVYIAIIHFLCIYTAVDWQVLTLGRLWDWSIGVWALDQGGASHELRAAVAVVGMVPVFLMVALCYPILSRYSLVPVLREKTR